MAAPSFPATPKLPPAGTRPPPRSPDPLLRLAALLLLIAAVALMHWRGELLAWAAPLLAAPPAPATKAPVLVPQLPVPRVTPPQLLAHALMTLLRPPALDWLVRAALAGLGLLACELLLRAAAGPVKARNERRAARALLRVRALPAQGNPAADAGLLRSLHALVPSNPVAAALGLAPWIALTLHGRPGEPVELGIALAAPGQRRLAQLVAAVRAAIAGHAPGALIELVDDPLAAPPAPDRTVAWRSFRMLGPLDLPLRTLADAEGDLLGPLASALRPTAVSYTELQLVLRPLRGWALQDGWRAAGLRRLLRLQQRADHALAPDARRLEARLGAPAFAAELHLVVLAEGDGRGGQVAAAQQQVSDALGVFAERTGPARQAIVFGGGRGAATRAAGQRALQRLQRRLPSSTRPARILLPLPGARPGLVLTVNEVCGLWHLPTVALAGLVRTQACRHVSAPMHAFLPHHRPLPPARDAAIALGTAALPDGSPAPVGLTLSDLRYVLHLTAGMGAGKSRLLANLCRQFLRSGYCLIDGKGDDAGGLSAAVLRRIPLRDEDRVVILDPRDARWPVGLNPLAGLDLRQPGAVDQAVANVFALFARIDPETWGSAQGMRDFLDKALRLVLAAEPHPTLANVKQCLLDADYRSGLLARCRNRDVVDYWQTIFPRLSEGQRASRDALLRRFDKLLSADLLRLMITRPQPELRLGQAIAERAIVLVPIPNVALGDLAGVYAMLVFQQFLRAAFARPGDDQSRVDYPLVVDELQVLIAEAANDDIETALSRLRAFAIPLILAHQARDQLGPVATLVDINAENRVILKTREPDASAYARQYGHRGLVAGDIINQDPSEHQYAVLRCNGQPAGPFSMAPLPWPEPLDEPLPPVAGASWQQVLPPGVPRDGAAGMLAQLAYADVSNDELNRRAEGLAAMPDELFDALLQQWDAVRAAQLRHITANPSCIPDKLERLRWRSRLRYGLPYVIAEAIYRRARPELAAVSPTETRRTNVAAATHTTSPTAEREVEPPAFAQADREPPGLARQRGGPAFPEHDDER